MLVTVGETMAVFCPEEKGMLRYAKKFDMHAAGAESNTAIGVGKLGHKAAWISALGEDELGNFILNTVRGEGVDCSGVYRKPNSATGLMFKEQKSRDIGVYYYRKGSAASEMSFEKLPLELIKEADILHLTGVTPVLGESCKHMIDELFLFANKHNITISFDPNIRKKLWKNTDYTELMREYISKSQIVLMGVEEAKTLYNTTNKNKIREQIFSSEAVTHLALKDGGKGAVVYDRNNSFEITPFPCQPVDTVGAGDAFNAGFLSGMMEGKSLEMCGKMGGICGALVTETKGDFEGFPSLTELIGILHGEETVYR